MVLKQNLFDKPNSISQIFTPNYIAKFMVKNLLEFIKINDNYSKDLKVLEPSVGKGVFLKYLLKNNLTNIVAYEIDTTLEKTLRKNFPNVEFKFENILGSNLDEEFDIIIGNPPYLGQNYNAGIFQDYIKNFQICEKFFVGNMDLFYYFIHLGIQKLKPGGILSFITTNYWITKSKKTGIKLLKPHIIEECYLVQYIDLSNLRIFKRAEGQHNCIFILQKKTRDEKEDNIDKSIEVIQITKDAEFNNVNHNFNEMIFKDLILGIQNSYYRKYKSALTNNNLKPDHSWYLLYPEENKGLVDKIESKCLLKGKISYLKDYFIVRNGLIFIRDEIFILEEGKNLKREKSNFYIKIKDSYVKILDNEKERLKKIYKSKSIKKYGYSKGDYIGYAIYFNKKEFDSMDIDERNKFFRKNYPNLTKYLEQYRSELIDILTNAKENPFDFIFPRRGTHIRISEKSKKYKLTDLEPFYESFEKIFISYITDENNFGYSNSTYYATSDTYFLWPKFDQVIDYILILAYLNSKLVKFLFKAKSIRIKRSKTKIEYDLPIINVALFNSETDKQIISEIKKLTSQLIQNNHNIDDTKTRIDKLFFQLFDIDEKEVNYLLSKYYTI